MMGVDLLKNIGLDRNGFYVPVAIMPARLSGVILFVMFIRSFFDFPFSGQ
jgi:hypothetical protein